MKHEKNIVKRHQRNILKQEKKEMIRSLTQKQLIPYNKRLAKTAEKGGVHMGESAGRACNGDL